MNKIPDVILDQRLVFVSNSFLPLLPACGMIDSFLHRCRFIFIVRVDVLCYLRRADSSRSFVEVFVLVLRRGKDALV